MDLSITKNVRPFFPKTWIASDQDGCSEPKLIIAPLGHPWEVDAKC